MKKIIHYNDNGDYINGIDSKDYIIIEKDNQDIDDKYVNSYGKKFSDSRTLRKGDIVIRRLYVISFGDFKRDKYFDNNYNIYFSRFKKYVKYNHGKENIRKIQEVLDTKNSVFNFDGVKRKIINLFSKELKIHS